MRQYLERKQIYLLASLKYLDALLDSKLIWNEHEETAVKGASRTFFQCRRGIIIGRMLIHWFYTVEIWSQISYTALVWWTRCNVQFTQKALERLHRLSGMGITGVMGTTPMVLLSMHLHVINVKRSVLLVQMILYTNTSECASNGQSAI